MARRHFDLIWWLYMLPSCLQNIMYVGPRAVKLLIDIQYVHACLFNWSAAMGDGFIARDITFVNSAGPAKHQAVALRVGSDKSVIFRCSVVGYQDTLYTHSKRQFYRETDIYGTVDFIFGNSAVVFQNCNIYVRKPLSSGQDNFITAQGRTSPDENTGISIHHCKISAASDLAPVKNKFSTYLGRPWKQYSRTIIMQSFLDDVIHPSGWSPWSGTFGLKTLYYGEYMNSGPGASTSGRVKWPGYRASITSGEAQSFTVAGFIAGHLWLPTTGVSFDSGLLGWTLELSITVRRQTKSQHNLYMLVFLSFFCCTFKKWSIYIYIYLPACMQYVYICSLYSTYVYCV